MHAFTQKSNSILPNTPFKLKIETDIFKMYMSRHRLMISEVKPKAKAWRHFKVEASYSLITHACLMPMGTLYILYKL